MVRRIEKGMIEDIFIQENYYFLCEPEGEPEEQNLDDYEAEERFTLEFVTVEHAIDVNNNHDHGDKVNAQTFRGMIDRENRVLEFVAKEVLGK